MYAIKIICKEIMNDGRVYTEEGEIYYVISTLRGYLVTAGKKLCVDSCVFETKEKAIDFTKDWVCHPWYVEPLRYEYVKVKPTYKQVVTGYMEES